MYDPAPARTRKTPITRNRTGCRPCRRKRVKCDEAKPSCRLCVSGGLTCDYALVLGFRDATSWAATKVQQAKDKPSGPRKRRARQPPSPVEPPEAEPVTLTHELEEPPWEHNPVATPSVTRNNATADFLFMHPWTDVVPSCDPDPMDFLCGLSPLDSMGHPPECHAGISPSSYPDPAHVAEEAPELWSPRLFDSSTSTVDASSSPSHTGRALTLDDEVGGVVADRVYMAHFAVGISPFLPGCDDPWMRQQVSEGRGPVHYAALALAAGNMAVIHGGLEQLGECDGPLTPSSSTERPSSRAQAQEANVKWVPKRSHMRKSFKYAVRAISMAQTEPSLPIDVRVATLLFLASYEMEVGSVLAMWRALDSIETTIISNKDELMQLPNGRNLLRAWLRLRARCRTMRGPHRPCCSESRRQRVLMEMEREIGAPCDMFGLVAAHAATLGMRILVSASLQISAQDTPADRIDRLRSWFAVMKNEQPTVVRNDGHQADTTAKDSAFASTNTQDSVVDDPFDCTLNQDQAFEELRALRHQLLQYPAPVQISQALSCLTPLSLDGDTAETFEPIRFPSHDEAMDGAMYAFAHIQCDEALLSHFLKPITAWRSSPSPSASRNPWLTILIRIAAGLDPAACARRNNFRTGILPLLHCAAMRCQDLGAFDFIDYLVCAMIDGGAYFEGPHTPLRLVWRANKVIRQEVANGRVLFAAQSLHVPSVDRDYTMAPNEQNGCIIVHGRAADGMFFQDYVSICD